MSLGALEQLFEAVSDKDKHGVQQCLARRREIELQLAELKSKLALPSDAAQSLMDHATRWEHVAWIKKQADILQVELQKVDQELFDAHRKLRMSFGKLIAIRAIKE